MDNNITENQIENNSEIKAISGDKVKSPQYLERLDNTAHSAKMVYYMWMSRLLVLLSVISMSFLVLASLALVYIIARAGSVIYVDPVMHPNMASATYSFDRNGIWSYSLVFCYNLLVLLSLLPRTMETLPFIGVFENDIHVKSD